MAKPISSSQLNRITVFWHQLLNSSEPDFVLMRLIIAGVSIRFCVMPFFCHLDFLSEWRRIHLQLTEFSFFPGARFVVTLVETINHILVWPFLGDTDSMLLLQKGVDSTAGHQAFFVFVSHPTIFRTLFLLKLSYLLFDMLSAWVIFRFTLKEFGVEKAWVATAVWIFNPITIFSFYIFGRYESIALFFLLLSFLMLKEKRFLSACIAFALCIWSREVFVLVLPFFVIALWVQGDLKWTRKLAGTLIILVTMGFVINALPSMMGFKSILSGSYGQMAEENQLRNIISFSIKWYYPLIIVYTLLAFYLIANEGRIDVKLPKAILCFFLAFFTFTVHSVHYVAWLFPAFCLFVPVSKHMVLAFVCFVLSWMAYWILATDLGVFTAWLAAPMSTHMLNLPNPPLYLAPIVDSKFPVNIGELASIIKSANVACLIFISILIFRNSPKPAATAVDHA